MSEIKDVLDLCEDAGHAKRGDFVYEPRGSYRTLTFYLMEITRLEGDRYETRSRGSGHLNNALVLTQDGKILVGSQLRRDSMHMYDTLKLVYKDR